VVIMAADTSMRCIRSKSGLKIGDQGSVCVAYKDDLRFPFTADPKGHILPSRIYPRVRWRFERRLTLRLDRKSPKVVRATLDAPCPLIPGSLDMVSCAWSHAIDCRSRWQCDRNTRLKIGIEVA
jgi:hypothetical protein